VRLNYIARCYPYYGGAFLYHYPKNVQDGLDPTLLLDHDETFLEEPVLSWRSNSQSCWDVVMMMPEPSWDLLAAARYGVLKAADQSSDGFWEQVLEGHPHGHQRRLEP
jgi:hypothetical protein